MIRKSAKYAKKCLIFAKNITLIFCLQMISSDVLLGSQDILDDSFWGPQNGFFGFSLGGYPEGGAFPNLILKLN